MIKPLLSIILSVYNVAPYLRTCIDSVLAQTYDNFELIMINDGSTDDSENICRSYAHRDNVVFINQTNHGLAYSHELGLTKARGELITFIDSDDFIDVTMYQKVIDAMTEYYADIGVAGIYLTDEQGQVTGEKFTGPLWTANREGAIRELLLEKRLDSMITNRVFRRHVLAGLHFPDGGYYDDLAFCYQAIHQCHRLVQIGEPLYYYRQRANSISYLPISVTRLDLLKYSSKMYRFMQQHYPQLSEEAAYLYYHNIKNARAVLAIQGADDPSTGKVIKHQFDEIFPAALRNRYFGLRDRAILLALKTNSYGPFKKLAALRP